MSAIKSSFSGANSWIIPVSLLAMVLGVMLRMAWITDQARSSRIGGLDPILGQRIGTGPIDLLDQYKKLQAEVDVLRKENRKFQSAVGNVTKSTKALQDSLNAERMFSAKHSVAGPGVVVTLSDHGAGQTTNEFVGSDQIIHDVDVLKVVNELWAAGAEAVSVNDHRVGARSSFRCVGPVIHVDSIPISSPIVVRAIGDPDVLFGALELPGGILAEIRSTDPNMVKLQKVRNMMLKGYQGPSTSKFAVAVDEATQSP